MNIENYIQKLDSNQNELFTVLALCSTENLTIKENDKWNILEILEHILITERALLLMILKSSHQLSVDPEIIGDEKLRTILVENSYQKWLSPENFHPKGKLKSIDDFRIAILKHRENFKNQLLLGNLMIDNRKFEHPYLGFMTVIDWLNFIIYHTERHFKQIKDLLINLNSKYMLIIHEVEDYKAWEKVFDKAAKIRKEAGEISYQVLCFQHDKTKVVHFSKWSSHQAAKVFFESPKLVQIRKEAGVKSPEIIYLDEIKSDTL